MQLQAYTYTLFTNPYIYNYLLMYPLTKALYIEKSKIQKSQQCGVLAPSESTSHILV